MRRMQAAQLHDDQEQEEADRQILDKEILSGLPVAYAASRDEGVVRFCAMIGIGHGEPLPIRERSLHLFVAGEGPHSARIGYARPFESRAAFRDALKADPLLALRAVLSPTGGLTDGVCVGNGQKRASSSNG